MAIISAPYHCRHREAEVIFSSQWRLLRRFAARNDDGHYPAATFVGTNHAHSAPKMPVEMDTSQK
jgi:hypothetical protein